MRIRTALVVLALPLALATACGSDEDTASDPASGTSTSPSVSATPTDPASTSPADPTTTEATPAPTADPTTGTTSAAPAGPDPSYPACADVWQKGAMLKAAYQGCNDGETAVKADVLSCSSGQSLVRYDDRFWAVLGGRIAKTASLQDDKDYLDSVASCRA